MTKAIAIRRPGKSSPATSRSVIQGPQQRSSTKRMAIETQNPSQGQPLRPICKGSQSLIPSELFMPVPGTTNDENGSEARYCMSATAGRGWAGLELQSPFRSLARTPLGTTNCRLEREHARETHPHSGVHRSGVKEVV
jgi:hypothetical protein